MRGRGAVAGTADDASATWMALKSGETGSGESHTTIFTIKTNLFCWFSVSVSHLCLYHMVKYDQQGFTKELRNPNRLRLVWILLGEGIHAPSFGPTC